MSIRWTRPALMLALLPALAACGHSTIVHPLPKTTVSASPNNVAMQMPDVASAGNLPSAAPTSGPAGSGSTGDVPLPAVDGTAAVGSVNVAGYVFDEQGQFIGGATITARSLDAAHPFTATATTQFGAYVLKDVPEAANIEISATGPGWTTRKRVMSFAAAAAVVNRCDFGAQKGAEGSEGAPYFIANRPEIMLTSPSEDNLNVNPNLAYVSLVLNTPLDAVNRTRLERALRVLPANDQANGGQLGTTTDLAASSLLGYPRAIAVDGNPTVDAYDVRSGSIFLNINGQPAKTSWNADGTELTLALPGPLLSSSGDPAQYQIALVSAGPGEAIRDTRGNILGSDANGGTESYPAAGQLIPAAFAHANNGIVPISGLSGAAWRWAATHRDAVKFSVADPDQNPVLTGVTAATMGNDTRFTLTFSQPMAAYSGSTKAGFVDASLGDGSALANITFAVGGHSADLIGVGLDRSVTAAQVIDPRTRQSIGSAAEQREPFQLDPAAYVVDMAGAPTGSVSVDIDPTDAHKVMVTVVGLPHFLDASVAGVAARAVNLANPSGHRVVEASGVVGGM